MRGDQTRVHPFHAACIYKTGVVCFEQCKVEAAVCVNSIYPSLTLPEANGAVSLSGKHLRDSVELTKFHAKEMPVEHARNLFKLSEALHRDSYNNNEEVAEMRD